MKKKASASKAVKTKTVKTSAVKPTPKKKLGRPVKPAVKVPALKVGDRITFATRHGRINREGNVVEVVQAGKYPSKKNLGEFKVLGSNKWFAAAARKEKTYLVESDGYLYWPKADAIF